MIMVDSTQLLQKIKHMLNIHCFAMQEELKRGTDNPKSVRCYMHESKASQIPRTFGKACKDLGHKNMEIVEKS